MLSFLLKNIWINHSKLLLEGGICVSIEGCLNKHLWLVVVFLYDETLKQLYVFVFRWHLMQKRLCELLGREFPWGKQGVLLKSLVNLCDNYQFYYSPEPSKSFSFPIPSSSSFPFFVCLDVWRVNRWPN